jgi:hypothetical protein
MRFSSLTILTLASVAAATDLKTWDDVVGDVPQCIKTCINDFYNTSGLKSKCGSADTATVNCVCTVKDTMSNINSEANDLSTCIQDGCSSSELADALTKLEDFTSRFDNLSTQCSAKGTLGFRFYMTTQF